MTNQSFSLFPIESWRRRWRCGSSCSCCGGSCSCYCCSFSNNFLCSCSSWKLSCNLSNSHSWLSKTSNNFLNLWSSLGSYHCPNCCADHSLRGCCCWSRCCGCCLEWRSTGDSSCQQQDWHLVLSLMIMFCKSIFTKIFTK